MRLKMRGYSTNFMLPTLAEETDLKMPGKTPAPQKEDRRRVQFNMEPTVHPVEHLNDISDRQIQAVWISFDEMAAIKQSYANIVKIMMRLREQFVEDLGKGICARGLEFRTREASKRRKRNKTAAIHAVLDEQEIQDEDGIHDPVFIAEVYRAVTAPVRQAARQRGLKDELDMISSLPKPLREEKLKVLCRSTSLDVPSYPKRRTSLE